jgi:MFS family permease
MLLLLSRPSSRHPSNSRIDWLLFLSALLVMFTLVLTSMEVIVSMLTLKANLHLNLVEMGWASSFYFLANAALIGVAGQYADIYGPTRLFLIGGLTFLIGSIILSVGIGFSMLILGRVLQGLGGSFILATSLTLARTCSPPEKEKALTRLWATTLFAAYVLGFLLGALMSEVNWRMNFWTALLLLIPGLWGVYHAAKKETQFEQKGCPDLVGTALLSVFMVLLLLLFTAPPLIGWTSATEITFIVLTPLCLIAFIVWENTASNPMVALRIFKRIPFSLGLLQIFLCLFSLFAFSFYAVLYLQSPLGMHVGLFLSGVCLLPPSAIIMLGCALAGQVDTLLGSRMALLLGWLTLLGGCLSLVWMPFPLTFPHLMWRLCVASIGIALLYPQLIPNALNALPRAESGLASGLVLTMHQLGIAIGIALAQVAYLAAFSSYLRLHLPPINAALNLHWVDLLHTNTQGVQRFLKHYPPTQVQLMHTTLEKATLHAYAYANLLAMIAAALGLVLFIGQIVSKRLQPTRQES